MCCAGVVEISQRAGRFIPRALDVHRCGRCCRPVCLSAALANTSLTTSNANLLSQRGSVDIEMPVLDCRVSHPLGTAHPFRTTSAPLDVYSQHRQPIALHVTSTTILAPPPVAQQLVVSRAACAECTNLVRRSFLVFVFRSVRSRLVSPCACSAAGAPPRVSRVHLYFFRLRVVPRRCRRGVGRRARLRGKGLPIFCYPLHRVTMARHTTPCSLPPLL